MPKDNRGGYSNVAFDNDEAEGLEMAGIDSEIVSAADGMGSAEFFGLDDMDIDDLEYDDMDVVGSAEDDELDLEELDLEHV